MGGRRRRRAQAWQRLKMPAVEYVDGFNVPNYEKRDPAPKYQMPMTRRRLDEVHPDAGRVRGRAVRAGAEHRRKPITFSFDERGRLWVIEAVDYPNRVLRGGAGRRPHQDPRGHQRRRPRRQVHRLRRSAEHPHEPGLRQRRRDRRGRAAHAVPAGHQRRRQGRRAQGAQHGWGISDTHAGPVEPARTGPTTGLGRRRLLRLRRRDERQADEVRQGVFRFKPDGSRLRVRHRLDQQHLGPRLQRDLRRLRLDGQQRSRASTSPSRTATSRASPGSRAGRAADRAAPATRARRSSTRRTSSRPTSARWTCTAATPPRPGISSTRRASFPKNYWNRIAFITEPTAHLVGQGIMEPHGAGFVTRDG